MTWNLQLPINGMDCAACARKVENAVKQVPGVSHVQVLFATEKLLISADNDVSKQVEAAVSKAGYSLRSESAPVEKTSPLRENLPLITLIIMMALSWSLEQINHPFGNLAFIATTLVGLFPIARQALRLMKSGSWFAIETLMSVAAIGALFIGATAEAAMVLLLFLIGERLEGWAASRARKGVSALMALKPETATRVVNGNRETVAINTLRPGDVIVLISNSGKSRRLNRMAKAARDCGATVVVISSDSKSPLARLADYTFNTVNHEALLTTGDFAFSKISATMVIEVIYNFLLPEIEDAREHISYYEELIQPDKVVE